jgi:hypothetical protein
VTARAELQVILLPDKEARSEPNDDIIGSADWFYQLTQPAGRTRSRTLISVYIWRRTSRQK